MKKRFLSLILVLSMLAGMFTAFATVTSAAESAGTPPSSNKGTSGTSSGEQTPSVTDTEGESSYLDLYVKEGLVALFDGYSREASDEILTEIEPVNFFGKAGYIDYVDPSRYTADISNGVYAASVYKWQNADGAISVTYGGYYGDRSSANYQTRVDLSDLGEIIGTTYTVQELYTQITPLGFPTVENGVVTYPEEAANFRFDGKNVFGVLELSYSYMYYVDAGRMTGTWDGWQGGFSVPYIALTAGGSYRGHHVLAGEAFGSEVYESFTCGKAYTNQHVATKPFTVERTVVRSGYVDDGKGSYTSTYVVNYDNMPLYRTGNWQWNKPGNSIAYTSTNLAEHTTTKLEIMANTGASYHSVRIYNTALSEAQINQNHMADLFAFYGSDMSDYMSQTPEIRAIVDTTMAEIDFASGKEAFEKALEDTLAKLVFDFDIDNTLYVTDGLTVLLAAYNTANTGSYDAASDKLLWYNGVTEGTYATLLGTGWKANANGGFTIVKNINTDCNPPNAQTSLYNYKEDFGVILQSQMVPEGDYTVEYVANPVGVTDDYGARAAIPSKNGLYADNSIAIGPLRAFQFDAVQAGSRMFQRRWTYGTGDSPLGDAQSGKSEIGKATGMNGNLPGYSAPDFSWDGIGMDQIISTTITLDTAGDHTYGFYQDLARIGTGVIPSKLVIEPDEDPRFRLMGHMAGTVYAVRVYDRVLSEAEMAQNHFADLVYYYGLDISAIRGAIGTMSDLSAITMPFADMGFDLTKEEAQAVFNENMVKIWLNYDGFGVRKDMKEGMRFYFDISRGGIMAMQSAGATVEIGAIVNIGKNAKPVLDGYGYDYKVIAFESTMGRETNIFVDEDTFAVTLRYENANREAFLKSILCQGYVKITLADGTSTVYYMDIEPSAPSYLFDGYNAALDSGALIDEEQETISYVKDRIESCYTESYVYLDAAAAEGGNGSAEAPFKYFEDAFAAAKAQMAIMNAPTHLYLSAKDGVYSVNEAQELTGDDKQYPYCDFTILSENGGSVLSTTVDLDASGFTSAGNNVYTYQFEKDENGNYPAFRHLFVNGKIADLAYNGSKYPLTETPTLTTFDVPFEGVWATAVDSALAGTLTLNSAVPEYYADRPELKTLYEYYRPRAMAYADVIEIYESLDQFGDDFATDSLPLRNAQPTVNKQAYKDAFTLYQSMYLGRYRAECEARLYGARNDLYKPYFSQAGVGDNKSVESRDENPELYVYQQARHLIYWTAKNGYNDDIIVYEIPLDKRVGTKNNRPFEYTGKDLDKYYLPESIIGDLRELAAKGKEINLALADELEIAFNQALVDAIAAREAAEKASNDATSKLNLLKSLKKETAEELISNLDALIAAAEANLAVAAEEDKAAIEFTLGVYNEVKAAIAEGDALAILTAKIDAQTEVNKALSAALTEAVSAHQTAQTNKATNDAYIGELRDEHLWMKHALEPYDIEVYFLLQYMQDIMDLRGVDYDDLYVAKSVNGVEETFYACYFEGYESFQWPAGGDGKFTIAEHIIYVANSIVYLDKENEFFYDPTEGKLYYYSESGVEGKTFARPTSDFLLKFDGVDNVTIRDFSFTGTDDYYMTVNGHFGTLGASEMRLYYEGDSLYGGSFPDRSAIYMNDVQESKISGCQFYELGCEGITARGWLVDVTVEKCSFENIGASAIRFGQNIRENLNKVDFWADGIEGNTGIKVVNNYVHDVAKVYICAAIQLTTAYNCSVQRNTVDGCSYSGISVGWQWSYPLGELERDVEGTEIAYNFVTGFMQRSHDGGAIYLPGPNAMEDDTRLLNSLHHNYVLYSADTGDGLGSFAAGLYFDGACSSYKVYENIIVTPAYGAGDGETDYGKYGITKELADRLAATREGACFIYLQHITNQVVNNILLENNYILNVREKSIINQRTEVYSTYLQYAKGKNVTDNDSTVYIRGVGEISRDVARIIMGAGASKHTGVVEDIMDNVY